MLSSSSFWKSYAHYYAWGYDLKGIKIQNVSVTSNLPALLVSPSIHTPTFSSSFVEKIMKGEVLEESSTFMGAEGFAKFIPNDMH